MGIHVKKLIISNFRGYYLQSTLLNGGFVTRREDVDFFNIWL